MNEQYNKFVSSLMKPEDDLNKEITSFEEGMMDSILKLSSFSDNYYNVIKENIIEWNRYAYGRPVILSLKHMALGFIGECGELMDTIKRITIYRKDILDKNSEGKTFYENIIEEIGDLIFFITGVDVILNKILQNDKLELSDKEDVNTIFLERDILVGVLEEFIESVNKYLASIQSDQNNIELSRCVYLNQVKLEKRYEKKVYSDKQATDRKDKIN